MAESFAIAYDELADSKLPRSADTEQLPEDLDKEAKELIAAGKKAAQQLIDSGALGEGPFSVGVSGQASEGHSGVLEVGAADSITVTVTAQRHEQLAEG